MNDNVIGMTDVTPTNCIARRYRYQEDYPDRFITPFSDNGVHYSLEYQQAPFEARYFLISGQGLLAYCVRR